MADPRFPSSKEVELFHTNSDKDGSPTSIHHTLGNGPNQASPGDHVHDGGTSKEIDIEDWQGLVFANSFRNYTGGGGTVFENVRFAQNAGHGYLHGLFEHPTTTTTGKFGSLPTGYWPKKRHIVYVGAGPGLARIDIWENGDLVVTSYIAGGNASFITLCSVEWPLG